MSREFSVVIERNEEGYYVASVPALSGCYTQARSLDELMEPIQEAIALSLEVAGEVGPGLEFVGVQRVKVPVRDSGMDREEFRALLGCEGCLAEPKASVAR